LFQKYNRVNKVKRKIMVTITVTPNQSMADVILQAMGSLEGGMVFCSLNHVAISDTPVAGTVYLIPGVSQAPALVAFDSDIMVDSGVLQYLGRNGILIGNLSNGEGVFVTEDGSEDFITEDGGESFVSE
jgi:hypothetical protein